ncbi:unnamed protein product [Prunus brigantina]
MALTLDLASQNLLLSQSPSLTIFAPTDAAFSLQSLPFGAKISTLLSDSSLSFTTLAYDPRGAPLWLRFLMTVFAPFDQVLMNQVGNLSEQSSIFHCHVVPVSFCGAIW